jgi:hypothetical protein
MRGNHDGHSDGAPFPVSSFILPTSSLDLRHAKINKNGKLKSIARRHIRAGVYSDPDLSDTQRLWRHKPI